MARARPESAWTYPFGLGRRTSPLFRQAQAHSRGRKEKESAFHCHPSRHNFPDERQAMIPNRPSSWVAVALLVLLVQSNRLVAAEHEASGTWLWNFTTPGGDTIQQKGKFKAEGEKLTGTIVLRAGVEVPIQEGKVWGNEISFQVVRQRDGNKTTSHYRGELKGDSITGKW